MRREECARVTLKLSDRLRRALATCLVFSLSLAPMLTLSLMAPARAAAAPARNEGGVVDGCQLQSAHGQIQHVIYVEFDNLHLTRDNPNVPSDLEQMPNLLNFIEREGVMMSSMHTPLISHTADDIITSLTGVYGDRHGASVANAFGFFPLPGTSTNFDGFTSAFTYWTDPVNPTTDPKPIMIDANGNNAPAPWVSYTRAGCNFGAVSIANLELENIGSDINNVFGPTSPQAAEAKATPTKAIADFEGIAIHCAAGDSVCSSGTGGRADLLPQEPGGYTGFNGLFGHAVVAPQISPSGPLTDLDGSVITDGKGNNGFPGFGGISASQSLGYVAAMQEHGVPVTFAYISDAHDDHGGTGLALGPGQARYVTQLQAYDKAFGEFFTRLKNDGIDQSNTLFVFTAEEGDHFVGGPPSPSNCDGVTLPCTYSKIGEIQTDITHLLNNVDPALSSTPFDVHSDMAPTFYIKGNPAPADVITRAYERATSKLTAVSPITGNTDQLTRLLADPVEMKLLHMITSDPQRTPNFVMFGDPDYFFQTSQTNGQDVFESPGFAWNHGGVDPAINTTWMGLVAPGVKEKGLDAETWADETDIRPTMLALVGLQDDYAHEGRVLVENFHHWALPDGVEDSGDEFTEVAQAFKKINAPVGPLGLASLNISTKALEGSDSTYSTLENQIALVTLVRDNLASQMNALLEDAAFHNRKISEREERQLVTQANILLAYVLGVANHL